MKSNEISSGAVTGPEDATSNSSNNLHSFSHNPLEEKEALLAAIVNSSEDAIISKTLQGIITSWNTAATFMFQYTESEAVGKHISLIIPHDRLSEETVIIENIRKGNKIKNFETIRVAKDGTFRHISLTVSPITNKQGIIIGASKIARDISYRIKSEEKQATLAAIINSSEDAIIGKSLEGIITSWNYAAARLFGYTEQEVIGKHISLIIPKDRMNEETMIMENITNGNKIDHFETVRIAKDGSEINISVTISPIKNAIGQIVGASKSARDISLRIQTEKTQKLYTERLQELNKYKDEFMVMASHELKTPLTVILANLQLLQLMLENDTNVHFLNKTLKQVYKLNDLITNLLDVSKIQTGKLVLDRSEFDINLLIMEVTDNLQKTTKDHKITFVNNNSEILIHADRDRIEQVIINILVNAIKYMPEPGEILLQCSQSADEVLISITDKGIGIPEQYLQDIFQRFYRVSGAASSFAGSGIGLYISAEIIKTHKGKIWAESDLGKGSVFYISIPVGAK